MTKQDHRARTSAEAAEAAIEHAARHVEGLTGLLAELPPAARRAKLARLYAGRAA